MRRILHLVDSAHSDQPHRLSPMGSVSELNTLLHRLGCMNPAEIVTETDRRHVSESPQQWEIRVSARTLGTRHICEQMFLPVTYFLRMLTF